MEALGAAGSVVGLAAALGQIIEGITQLHDFWSSVKEVPKSLLWLITDLEILHDILRSIDSSSAQLSPSSDTSALNGILQRCALYLKTLQETVKPLQSETGVSTAKRTWRSVKAVFSTEKIKSYRENLEAAKVTLLLAQNQLNHKQSLGSITNLQCSLATMSLNQITSSRDIAVQSKEIKESVLRLESILHREIQGLTSLTALNHENPLASFLSSSVEKTISSVVQNALNELSVQGRTNRTSKRRKGHRGVRMAGSPSIKVITDESHTQPPKSSKGGNETTELEIGALIPPKECLVHGEVGRGDRNSKQYSCQFWQTYKTIFGTVRVHVYRIVREPSNGDSELPFKGEDTCSTEVEIQFTPRLWLARKASHVTGAWESSPHRNAWRFDIQSFPVVDHNSEIIKACESCDIRKMQTLFDSKHASPFDVTQGGDNLFTLVLMSSSSNRKHGRFETCKFLLESGYSGSNYFDNDQAFDYVFLFNGLNPEKEREDYEDSLKLIRLLVETVKMEHLENKTFATSLFLGTIGSPIVPPALEYLCKQETLDFSLKNVIQKEYSTCIASLTWIFPNATTLRILLDCGIELTDLGWRNNGELLGTRIFDSFSESFDNPEEQRMEFNGRVLEFITLLRAGVDPNTHIESMDCTAALLVKLDPHFTEVAWSLALDLAGWGDDGDGGDGVTNKASSSTGSMDENFVANSSKNNGDSADSDNQEDLSDDGVESKHQDEDEDGNKDGIESEDEHEDEGGNEAEDLDSPEIDENGPSLNIPGAWVEEEPYFPIRRKFKSKRSDFNGSYNGFVWPRHMYMG